MCLLFSEQADKRGHGRQPNLKPVSALGRVQGGKMQSNSFDGLRSWSSNIWGLPFTAIRTLKKMNI